MHDLKKYKINYYRESQDSGKTQETFFVEQREFIT